MNEFNFEKPTLRVQNRNDKCVGVQSHVYVKFRLKTRVIHLSFPSDFRAKLWVGLGLGVGIGLDRNVI